MPASFRFTRLDAYQAAASFVGSVEIIVAGMPRGRAYLVDQLRRAALSIQANIAEGAGEFSPADKARFYRMALRSATECGALLHSALEQGWGEGAALEEAMILADRIIAMTTKLVLRFG